MNYLSIGTNSLSADLFLEIKNSDGVKPIGGLWATEHNNTNLNYNDWVEYLCYHPYVLFYHQFNDPYMLPAIYFTLKDSSNIFVIDSIEKINFLKNKYPHNDWIDYEKLSQNFDGIFVDINALRRIDIHRFQNIIDSFSVSTLVLFNLNCIKYYQKASIDLTGTDFENPYEFSEYKITVEKEKKEIDTPCNEVQSLIKIIKRYIIDNNIEINYENCEIINKIFQNTINEALKFHDIPNKDMLLIRKVFNQF